MTSFLVVERRLFLLGVCVIYSNILFNIELKQPRQENKGVGIYSIVALGIIRDGKQHTVHADLSASALRKESNNGWKVTFQKNKCNGMLKLLIELSSSTMRL